MDNLQQRVIDWEGKLVKLAALEAAFDHFTNKHWIPLQAVVISLHDSLCWTCRGDGQPIPDQVRSASAPPFLSIAILVPPPHSGQRPATPSPPPSLPLSTMTPPLSPTPLTTPPLTCSMSKGKCSKQHKGWMDLYGPMKRGQHCKPSSPIS